MWLPVPGTNPFSSPYVAFIMPWSFRTQRSGVRNLIPIRHDCAIILQMHAHSNNRPPSFRRRPESRVFGQREYGGISTNWYKISRYRSRGIRNTFYFLPPPAISAPSAVSPDAPGIDKQELPYYTFHMRSPISQLYNNVKNAPECPRMPHFSKNSPDSQVLALPRLTPLNHSSEPPSAAAYAEASECSNVRAGA